MSYTPDSGGSSAVSVVSCTLDQDGSGPNLRSDSVAPGSDLLACGPIGLGAGAGFGLELVARADGLTLSEATIFVSNADGTERLILDMPTPLPLTNGNDVQLDMGTWDAISSTGSDLAWDAGAQHVLSAAGGHFWCWASLTFTSA